MYTMKNGILFKNGKPQIGLGTSYFASYHPEKYPVAPEDNRLEQMKLDIRDIAEYGFNNVRTAAIEQLWWEGEQVKMDFPFIDAMVEEISRCGMSSVVRLNGYSMNHRNHPENTPVDQNGEHHQTTFVWDCLSNEEVLSDAYTATAAQAVHFSGFPDMVGYQIYNEPAYPWTGGSYYDYSAPSIRAYRKWLVEKGLLSQEEAADCQPPKSPPQAGGDFRQWLWFRMFNTERMTNLLTSLNRAAKDADPKSESMTNMMNCPFAPGTARMGEDYFPVAEGMDYLGLDLYSPQRGMSYYFNDLVLSAVECAAAVQGKHAWIVEYCCRTHMTIEDMEREGINALGAGFKGINYYAWRSDVLGPEGGLGGIIRADRSKTPKYEEGKKLLSLIGKLSEELASAHRVRDGVAILYSTYANNYSDALGADAPVQTRTLRIHAQLKEHGVTADYLTAEALEQNSLGTRLLLVPALEFLSPKEQETLELYAQNNPVFLYSDGGNDLGFHKHPACPDKLNGFPLEQNWCYKAGEVRVWHFRLKEVLEIAGIQPDFSVVSPRGSIGFGYLRNETAEMPYAIACLTNIDSFERPTVGGKLFFNGYTQAVFYARDTEQPLPIRMEGERNYVELPPLSGGAFVLLR